MSLIHALSASLETETAPALIYGSKVWSRGLLAHQAARLAAALERLGVGPGDRVALLCPNHPAFAVAALAILARGAVLVPLNPLYRPGELASLLRACAPRALICLSLCQDLAAAACHPLPPGRRPSLLTVHDPTLDAATLALLRAGMTSVAPGSRLDSGAKPPMKGDTSSGLEPEHEVNTTVFSLEAETVGRLKLVPLARKPADPAVLFFTSGTTGAPKAAMLSQANLESNARFLAREWLEGLFEGPPPPLRHRTLAALPLCHNFGLNVSLNTTLLHGGTLVLLPRFTAVLALRAIAQHQVSFLPLTPSMVQMMLSNPELKQTDISSLRIFVSGGAALPGPLRQQLLAQIPDLELRDTYGLSEASNVTSTRRHGVGKPGTVGRPAEGTAVEIRDEAGKACPIGEVGEIWVKGPGVMAGYWPGPLEGMEATAEGMGAEVGRTAAAEGMGAVVDGWLRTGDLGFLDGDGDLTVVDRKKDLIIRGGYKVYPLEVEEVLYRHPAVLEAAVYGLPAARMDEQVVACVALRPGAQVTPAELKAFCKQQLAEYKVPAVVEIRETLPRGSTGKILRRALREAALARAALPAARQVAPAPEEDSP